MKTNFSTLPDVIFPTDNALEIPSLRLDMQPEGCEIPFVCFGEQKRTFDMAGTGTLHFYTDDYRFNSVYENPEKILKYEPANIVEPNFSLFNEMPLAFGIQSIYKKRVVARQMQDKGIGVFVDLNVANKWYALNLYGVPRGWRSFATRGYEDRVNALEFEYQIALRVAETDQITFVVYGGGERIKQWCRERNAVYVSPIITLRNKMKSIERQLQNVALLGEDYTAELERIKQEIFGGQVCDFGTNMIETKATKGIGE